jgi:hypothetical protein
LVLDGTEPTPPRMLTSWTKEAQPGLRSSSTVKSGCPNSGLRPKELIPGFASSAVSQGQQGACDPLGKQFSELMVFPSVPKPESGTLT